MGTKAIACKSLWFLALAAFAALPSCGRSGSAGSRSGWVPTERKDPNEVAIPRLPWEPPGTPETHVSMPELSKELMEKVDVKIEELAVDPLALRVPYSLPKHAAVAIKVAVRSDIPNLLLLVDPSRFTLESEKGQAMPQRFSNWKDPPLATQHLKTGETVSGWIFFLVPKAESKFQLKSDLRREPPIAIPVDLATAQ